MPFKSQQLVKLDWEIFGLVQNRGEFVWRQKTCSHLYFNSFQDAESCQKVAMVAEVADIQGAYEDSSDEDDEDLLVEDDLYQDEDEEDDVDSDEELRNDTAPVSGRRARLEWDHNI